MPYFIKLVLDFSFDVGQARVILVDIIVDDVVSDLPLCKLFPETFRQEHFQSFNSAPFFKIAKF